VAALAKAKANKKPLADFLLARSRDWLDNDIERLRNEDFPGHLDIIRENIAAKRKGVPAALLQVYDEIARAIDTLEPFKLAAELQELSHRVHAAVGEAVKEYGGPSSQTRWNNCPRAFVNFVYPEPGPTRCSFSKGPPDRINIHIGSDLLAKSEFQKGALRTFFNLHFFFFHEYLSHSFAIWQEANFVEGYLVWAERELHFRVTGDKVRKHIIDQTFAARPESEFQTAEAVASWFQTVTGERFLQFLLEWAALGAPQDDTLMPALFQVSELFSAAPTSLAALKEVFHSEDVGQILGGILALAQDCAGIPQFQFRLQ
jgi:hypothetical protein